MEYTKLRSVVGADQIRKFQRANEVWIRQFFPNLNFPLIKSQPKSRLQILLEKVFNNRMGDWLERRLGQWQQNRIRQDQFVFVRKDELSFHPESKHTALLEGFFQ